MLLVLPIRTVSEANQRNHHFAKAKRVKEQRKLAKIAVSNFLRTEASHLVHRRPNCAKFKPTWGIWTPSRPLAVTITRVGKRRLDKGNLGSSLKAVEDGIADALGVDDGDESACTWDYQQRIDKYYAVEILIQERLENRIFEVEVFSDRVLGKFLVWAKTLDEAKNTTALYLDSKGESYQFKGQDEDF